MDFSIKDCHDMCEDSFQGLINSSYNSARDYSAILSPSFTQEEFGRFRVWTGNVGAHIDPERRISLDYRLREAKFYRDKIIHHLLDLQETLQSSIELVNGDRDPFDECTSSDSDVSTSDDSDDEAAIEDGNEVKQEDLKPILAPHTNGFAALRDVLKQSKHSRSEHVSFAKTKSLEAMTSVKSSSACAMPDTEISQLRTAICDIIDHLYKLAMLIRSSVPTDRLSRSNKIDVRHFEPFDLGYVRDCFPNANEKLQEKLAKAITRRRQILIYHRKHHEHLSRPKPPSRATSKQMMPKGTMTLLLENSKQLAGLDGAILPPEPQTDHTIPFTSRTSKSTIATNFNVPAVGLADHELDVVDWENGTQSFVTPRRE
ncbi:hypothetical protein EJ08DRAFT_484631 [Tothia fuscella]|uniref:Uncharacterized protein n=1 Tax=Tothia fuscella TaxID=1048955 RepID=A0A9P4TUA6_9PEZI|nr:hypothetical protein EJ08DRAFT_484631 [Tothia fuscella]